MSLDWVKFHEMLKYYCFLGISRRRSKDKMSVELQSDDRVDSRICKFNCISPVQLNCLGVRMRSGLNLFRTDSNICDGHCIRDIIFL